MCPDGFAGGAFLLDGLGHGALGWVDIGSIIAMSILATGNITGASFNSARTLGPYVTDTVFGGPSLWGTPGYTSSARSSAR